MLELEKEQNEVKSEPDLPEINISHYLTLVSLEYNAMRDEIRLSHQHIFAVLQLYFPIVGVLVGLTIQYYTIEGVMALILAIAIPIISLSSITFILSESVRMKRAGDYICKLERNIASIYKKSELCTSSNLSTPLHFETWIREINQIPPQGEWTNSDPDGDVANKRFLGRANTIIQARFVILFAVPFFSWLTSTITAISSGVYSLNLVLVIAGFVISVAWLFPLLRFAFKFSFFSKK